jgi:hypothetical protein
MRSTSNEYDYQRRSTQYFLWEARKRGIEVLVAAMPERRRPLRRGEIRG